MKPFSFLHIFFFINLIYIVKTDDEPSKSSNQEERKKGDNSYDPDLSYSENDISFSNACRSISYPSKLGCSVAPRTKDYRCCYVRWKDKSVIDELTNTNGKCDFFIDKAKYLKNYKSANKEKYGSINIECGSEILTKSIINFLFILSILLLF